MKNRNENARNHIRGNYANVARQGIKRGSSSKSSNGSCCGGGCCCGSSSDVSAMTAQNGYTKEDVMNAPLESNMGLGCGNPVAIAGLKEGETVLDLGCGGGFDCFLARRKVGESGYVIGVDMTPEMITLARNNADKIGFTNTDFRLGEIEHLPLADSSVDVIISNCVINLSLNKQQVFKEAYRVLKEGGRLSISDVVATRPLPEHIKNDLELVSCCIGGAEYMEDMKNMLANVGFEKIRLHPKENSSEMIKSWFPDKQLEDYVCSCEIEACK